MTAQQDETDQAQLVGADKVDHGFNPLTLAFNDGALESAFIQEHNRRARRPLRVVIVMLASVVAIQTAVEYYGFLEEGWDGYELWEASLPYRILDVALLLFGLVLTWVTALVRWGQPIVAAFIVALFALFIAGAGYSGEWIERTATMFNYGIVVVTIALGLLFRFVAPMVTVMTFAFSPIIISMMQNPFAPLFFMFATLATILWISYAAERARREAWAGAQALEDERALTERLLLNVLPPSIASRMQDGETLIADSHDEATVVFADIVNFTPLSSTMSPEALVEVLDDIFAGFDRIADEYDLEKIKTIGDAYMMAAGLPTERSGDPAHALDAALAMRDWLRDVAETRGIDISMRAGVHIGPVVAGVIGRSKFVYDLWGDSVNIASRMESSAPVGEVQVSDAVKDRMEDTFEFEDRGEIDVKGKGRMRVALLKGRLT
ncbi:MAG: adenylate/guanylate cyclase domain-containing protein [Pseudomonadota bacterium]